MELNSFPIYPRYSNIDSNSDPYHDFFLPCFSNSTYYGRYGTATTFALENAISGIEKGYRTVATSSGMSAISISLLSAFRSPDRYSA